MADVNWSGIWNGHYGEDYTILWNRAPGDDRVALALRRSRYATRTLNALIDALNGTAPGGTAQAIEPRVAAKDTDPSGQLGGLRTIENYELINRPTTTADRDYVDSILERTELGQYVQDASGNRTTDAGKW